MAGLPLGDTSQPLAAVMLNVLGDAWYDGERLREPAWAELAAVPGAKLHLYGKREARRGRKMGHVTCVAAQMGDALARAQRAARALAIVPGPA